MGLYTKLFQLNPAELSDLHVEDFYPSFYLDEQAPKDQMLDLDKSLPGIKFLLSGSTDVQNPNQHLLIGKTIQLADGDTNIICEVLMPDEIRKVNMFLSDAKVSDLKKNFDPPAMTALAIYPDIWDYGKESCDYLYTHFLALKKFISHAAQCGKAVVIMTA
ncbi:DUF1877 family protein [Mucilaginibacter sp. Mucisp86]|uniref:DUF1877 family protein n=1 Tax=Mucilaginibacter sp. Mucisp86 TaxID=3243060 RepID=UPI0039B5A3BE